MAFRTCFSVSMVAGVSVEQPTVGFTPRRNRRWEHVNTPRAHHRAHPPMQARLSRIRETSAGHARDLARPLSDGKSLFIPTARRAPVHVVPGRLPGSGSATRNDVPVPSGATPVPARSRRDRFSILGTIWLPAQRSPADHRWIARQRGFRCAPHRSVEPATLESEAHGRQPFLAQW